MTRWSAPLALLLAVTAPAGAAAQTLTLDAAVAEATDRHPDVRLARAALDRRTADRAVARAARLPDVTFSESWQRVTLPVAVFGARLSARRFTAADFAIDALNRPPATAVFATRFSVQQVVFDFGRRAAAESEAAHSRDAAVAALEEAAAAASVAVTQVYGRILTARARERATTAAAEAAAEDLARATRRRDAGLATDADVLAVAVQVADLRERAIDAHGEALVAMAELNHLRGAPVAATFDVELPPALTAPAALTAELPRWLAEVDGSRAAVRQAAADLKAADARVQQAQRSWAPAAAAVATYALDGLSIGAREGAWAAGAELRWSLNLGGAERARVRGARAGAEEARAAFDAARSRAQLDIVDAVRRLETAHARVAAVAEAVRQAAESLRITRNRYEAGIASLTDVLRAVSAEVDTQHRHTAAGVDVLVAEAHLRRAIGRARGTPLK